MSSPISSEQQQTSPQNLQIIQTTSGDVANSPPPEMEPTQNSATSSTATVINTSNLPSVLDLHKDSIDVQPQQSSQQHQHHVVYVDSLGHPHDPDKLIDEHPQILHRIHQAGDDQHQIIDARMIQQTVDEIKSPDDNQNQITKIELTNDQIYRVVEGNQIITKIITANGESQIISREIIDGEHHILTRNENGDHVIIVDPTKMPVTQYTTSASPVFTTTGANDHIATSVLHYTGGGGDVTQSIVGENGELSVPQTATSSGGGSGGGTSAGVGDDDPNAIKSEIVQIYADDGGDPKVKPQNHIIYSTQTSDGKEVLYDETGKQIDMLYEDGKQTIIYTTTDPKALELYSGGELGTLVGSDGQVIQGGIQYAQQQPNGTTVLVVQEMVDGSNIAEQR